MKRVIEKSPKNFLEILDDTLSETVNNGLDEDAIEYLNDKEIAEANNEYRLYGQLFGLNYIMNLLKNLGIEIKERED